MEKQFVPYDLAVKLKELGFDEKCFSFYWNTPSLKHHKHLESGIRGEVRFDQFNNENRVSAPLWQQIFNWFREKGFDSLIKPIRYVGGEEITHWSFSIQTVKYYKNYKFETYEEARLECLKKLIKLVKN